MNVFCETFDTFFVSATVIVNQILCVLHFFSYIWKKDGVRVNNSRSVSVNESSGELTILDATHQYGEYQCFASNGHGTAVSNPLIIKRPST